jgi:hypothetical protein
MPYSLIVYSGLWVPELIKRGTIRNMASRKNRLNRVCSRNQMGGNIGQGYTIGAAVAPGAPGDALRVTYPSCDGGVRPGMLSSVAETGLPGLGGGMFGGKRRRRGSKRSQRGAGYGFSAPSSTDLGSQGGLAGISRTACEMGVGAYRSPTISTLPEVAMKMSGGSAPFPMALEVPTAGYSQGPSPWVGSTGAPVELAIPVAGRAGPSAACMQTGGKRRSVRKLRSARRKTHRKSKRSARSRSRSARRKSHRKSKRSTRSRSARRN